MQTGSAASSTSWPFVGRDKLVEQVVDHARDAGCGGVLLTGEAGVGKTRLADEVLSLLRDEGWTTLRAVGTPAARTTPFGAVAHAIPPEAIEPGGPIDPMRIFLALRGDEPSGRRTLVMVDDLPFLDDATFTLLTQLLSAELVFVVCTARTGTAMPPSADSLVRAFNLRRLEVGDLSHDDVIGTAENVFGCAVDPMTAHTLWSVTAGNALYVRELLLGAIEAGAVERRPPSGLARLTGDAWASRRLVEFVGERLDSIAAELSDALSLLAVAEPLLLSDLEREGLLDDAVELERLGVVQVDESGQEPMIRLSHPLHGEVLRSRLGLIARRRHIIRAIDLVTSRPQPRADDPPRIATWRLDVGQAGEPEVLLAGARLARGAMDYPSTIRLARAAFEAQPTAAAQHLLVEALFINGDSEESEAIAAMEPPDDIDPFTFMLLVAVRVNNLVWGVNDPEAALDVVNDARQPFADAGLTPMLTIIEASVHAFDGRPALALEILGSMASDPGHLILGATAAITALGLQGRFDEAVHLSERAYKTHMTMANPKSLLDPGNHLLTQGTALLGRGDFARAEEICREAHAEAVRDRVTFMRCWHALVVGKSMLHRGRLDAARSWFTDALAAAEEIRLRPGRRQGHRVGGAATRWPLRSGAARVRRRPVHGRPGGPARRGVGARRPRRDAARSGDRSAARESAPPRRPAPRGGRRGSSPRWAWPARRSPIACTCRSGRSATTCRTCTPSSASPAAPRSPPPWRLSPRRAESSSLPFPWVGSALSRFGRPGCPDRKQCSRRGGFVVDVMPRARPAC